jgi:hypothetical protein
MSLGSRGVVSLVLAALGAWACTRNPYVIGSVCPTAGVDAGADADPRCSMVLPAGGTLAADFDHSGASALGPLMLTGGAVAPTLRLRGERAAATGWPTESGSVLGRGTGVPSPGLGAPFTDGTSAVGLPADAPAYVAGDATLGSIGADDFALEVVLRAAAGASLLAKQAGATGWSLHADASGDLLLDLGDGDATHAAEIVSEALTTGAWYHCLFWVSRAEGGRADCDGHEGVPVTLPALGALDAPTAPLSLGGGAAAQIAYVALHRVPAGGLGAATSWSAVSARRFVTLAGAYPRFAGGTYLPSAGLRDSEAYLDLQAAPGAPRRLYLVGADWPRVACRTDAAGVHDCGYLSEPERTRGVPGDASAWQPAALTVAATATPFADGEPRFAALAPSTVSGAHALSFTTAAAGARLVFSFFVHRVNAARVGANAGGAGTAVFDPSAGSVVSTPAGVVATIEAWGNGIFRCTYAFAAAGPTAFSVRLLDDAGNETFAGTGVPAVEVAGLQVDTGPLARSLLGADMQPADRLTFRADDGNFPTGSSGLIALRMLLPPGARLTDQAIVNVNLGGSFNDQVQLFVRGDLGLVKFWELSGGAMNTHWTFDGVTPVIDGRRHALQASWDAASAHLVIDGASASMPAIIPNTQPFGFDRIDVGFSESSGALEGLIAGLQIGAM